MVAVRSSEGSGRPALIGRTSHESRTNDSVCRRPRRLWVRDDSGAGPACCVRADQACLVQERHRDRRPQLRLGQDGIELAALGSAQKDRRAFLPQYPIPVWPVRDVVAIVVAPAPAIRFRRRIGGVRFLSKFERIECGSVTDSIPIPRSSNLMTRYHCTSKQARLRPPQNRAGDGRKVFSRLPLLQVGRWRPTVFNWGNPK